MELRVVHRTAVEPTVYNFGRTNILAAALASPFTFVYKRTVQFDILTATALFGKFLATAYYVDFSAFVANPYG